MGFKKRWIVFPLSQDTKIQKYKDQDIQDKDTKIQRYTNNVS